MITNLLLKVPAALALIIIALSTSIIHYITLSFVGTNIDHGAILSGYLGLH